MVRRERLAPGDLGGAGMAPRSEASGGAGGAARRSRAVGVVGQPTGSLRRLVRWSRATAAARTTAPVAGSGVLCCVAT